ncbi:hypothetical protein LguiB_010992 [Lonicera macranthoides]
MKGMPLPFDFEGKGVVFNNILANSSYSSSSKFPSSIFSSNLKKSSSFLGCIEPTSVLDNNNNNNIIYSPSPPTSTSTLSSSLGGGGSGYTDTASVAAVSGKQPKWPPGQQQQQQDTSSSNPAVDHHLPPELDTTAAEKCGMGLEDWESVLSESVEASPGQEQSILRWIMGDVDDQSMGLNKVLQIGGGSSNTPSGSAEFEFSCGFGAVDQALGFDPFASAFPLNKFDKIGSDYSKLPLHSLSNSQNHMFTPLSDNSDPFSASSASLNQHQHQQQQYEAEVKPLFNNQQMVINQHQAQHLQNPAFFMPLPQYEQEQEPFVQPNPKRHNPGSLDPGSHMPKSPFLDSGQQIQGLPPQLQLVPPHLQPRTAMPTKLKMAGEELHNQGQNHNHHQHQQAVIDQLYKAADLVQSGNPVHAQEILARLNQHLSPIGKPFHRAAFYIKEALQLLLHPTMSPSSANSPFSLIFKIGAYKSFSEISPLVQFANFTCNQALLEALDGFDRIHIVDFDIGYGGQWASLMQELALRCGGAPAVKITAFVSPSTHDQLELGLARENLNHFASDINIAFEFEIVNLDVLNSNFLGFPFSGSYEGIAVNLPVGSFFNYQVSLPSVLRFIKHLSPKIVVSVDRGCDRTDLPFPNHVIHILQSYSNLLESLDAVNVNLDALQKIERFLLKPGIEKVVMGRYRSPEKTQHWRTLFLSAGFSPLTFSNFTESQAECVVKRTPIRGFHVEKRQTSLVLCWQRRELISASVWRC